VVSATTDPQVARVLAVIGRDDESHRARFGKSADRILAADELDALVADWIARHARKHVLDTFARSRIPAAPVNDLADLFADPHILERESLVKIEDAALGTLTLVAPTPKLSATPGVIRHTGPELGEHNREVYREWIGLEDDAFSKFVADGTI
jgi:crotonobetainyl-CoA:carnitine CoA-transferase CaiB-like acyl-CoA transferase